MKKIALSLIAENLIFEIAKAENQGKKPLSKVNIPVEGEPKGFDLTAQDAQVLVDFRELLKPIAKAKLDTIDYATQIEMAHAVVENWA